MKYFDKKNLEQCLEYYQNHHYEHSEFILRKLYLNYNYLFKPFDKKFLFVSDEQDKITIFDSIEDNLKNLLIFDKEKIKKEIGEIKFKYIKKIFCNSLWIDNNPSFIEETLWRFLISSPKTFYNFFEKKPKNDHFKLMIENGFIKDEKIYKRMTKRLQKHINSLGNFL